MSKEDDGKMTNRITRPRQGKFRRRETFVVVRPVQLTKKDVLEVGTEVKRPDYRAGYLRSLFLRRRIGVKGSAWTEWMLARRAGLTSQEAAEIADDKRAEESDADSAAKAQAEAASKGAKTAPSPQPDADADQATEADESAPEGGVTSDDGGIEDMLG